MSGGVVGRLRGGQLSFEWDIPHFFSLPAEADKRYDSPAFFFGDTSWYIRVYPNGQTCKSSIGHVGMYVLRGDSGPPVHATYGLFLKMADGKRALFSDQKNTFRARDHAWGQGRALKRSELFDRRSEFMPSGKLTVVCSLKLDEEREVKAQDMLREALKDCNKSSDAFTQTEADPDLVAAEGIEVLRDYKGLLRSEEYCDVTLQVDGQKFQAHRAILGARSPVFASMLRHDMKEKNTGLIDIGDCDGDVFRDFLDFVYCGSVDHLTFQNASSLYRAADKYDVADLKRECLAYMESHLEVANICDVIALSWQHGEAELLKRATDFFAKNLTKIIVTVQWRAFLDENTTQGNELLIKALAPDRSQST